MSKRTEKLAETIHAAVSSLLLRGLNDPRIGFVTITAVEVVDDLSAARVFFTVMGDEKSRRDTEAGLNSAKGFIRKELGRVLTIRHIPEIIFKFDHSQEYGSRIDSILKEIAAEHDRDDSENSQ